MVTEVLIGTIIVVAVAIAAIICVYKLQIGKAGFVLYIAYVLLLVILFEIVAFALQSKVKFLG